MDLLLSESCKDGELYRSHGLPATVHLYIIYPWERYDAARRPKVITNSYV